MLAETLIKLIGSGNSATVEQEWMRIVESPETPLSQIAAHHAVLAELCRLGRNSQAEELAWAAIEAVLTRTTPLEALRVAGPYLLAIGESSELRDQVAKLYREAYADRAGLEDLIAEAGLLGSKPVRRAIRTMDVALAIRAGDYLLARDEDAAAKIESIDSASWEITISHIAGIETHGVVLLADGYYPAPANSFHVMRHYHRPQLILKMSDAPASFLLDLCRDHGNAVDADQLESLLIPEFFTEIEWKKWFTKARAAVKKLPGVTIEGRSPYVLRYVEAPSSLELTLREEFGAQRDPFVQLASVEKYLRDSRARKLQPDAAALRVCVESLLAKAVAIRPANAVQVGVFTLVAGRIAELSGTEAPEKLAQWFADGGNFTALVNELEDEGLFDLACAVLAQSRPDAWKGELIALLPTWRMSFCDRAALRLGKGGAETSDFEPIVQRIASTPASHFEALLWLWDGPSDPKVSSHVPLLGLLTKILRTVEDCRRGERIAPAAAKVMANRAKSVLSARRYERFVASLSTMEPAMANAIRSQVRKLENLGRSTRDDLLSLIRKQFGTFEAAAQPVAPWAREDVLFTTSRGLSRKHAELEHHINVKMKENAKAIGAAAEHGDLSENSEYKFALEERDLLRARLAQMNAELSLAAVITPDQVPTDHVGVGTRVILRRTSDGLRYDLSFVGPWDADASANLLNYRAPVAQDIMGKRVGDVIELNHTGAVGTYELMELQNALSDEPAEASTPEVPEESTL